MTAFVSMLGYNRIEMVRGAMENFRDTVEPGPGIRKLLFSCDFPLPEPQAHRELLNGLACEFDWEWNMIPNEGCVENHNKAIFEYGRLVPGDFYVTFDPDVRMREKGWLPAMVTALQNESEAVFVCAARSFHHEEWCAREHGRQVYNTELGPQVRVARWRELVSWSMGMYKAEWLLDFMGRDFKVSDHYTRHAVHPHYGYGEHAHYALMQKHSKHWLSLVDFHDDHVGADPLLTAWKMEAAAVRTVLPFDQWLKQRGL